MRICDLLIYISDFFLGKCGEFNMDKSDYLWISSTLLQLNGGFLGVTIMLIALVPALFVVFSQDATKFVHNEKGKRMMEKGLVKLRLATILFALGCFSGIISMYYRRSYMLWFSGITAIIGLGLIVYAAFRLTHISKFVIGRGEV